MCPARRRYDTGVTQRLLDEPYRFGYFQAVRLLEQYFVRKGMRSRNVVADRVRFENTLSLSFPPSELMEASARADDGSPIDEPQQRALAVEQGDVARVHITPAFFGLLGANGALPLQYTERLTARETYQRDRAARAFFDVFSNRSASLFYEAWKKYRLALRYETDREDRALPTILALAGVNYPRLRERLADEPGQVFPESAAYYAGTLWRRPTSATMVKRTVADYFGVDVELEQFVPRWYPVPAEQQTYLGQNNATLGGGALAGERVLQCDLCIRLWIGPLDRATFANFLPGGASAEALKKLVQLMTGVRLEYDVRLLLAPEAVQGAALGGDRDDGRLGWDAFLVTKPQTEPRAEAGYQIS